MPNVEELPVNQMGVKPGKELGQQCTSKIIYNIYDLDGKVVQSNEWSLNVPIDITEALIVQRQCLKYLYDKGNPMYALFEEAVAGELTMDEAEDIVTAIREKANKPKTADVPVAAKPTAIKQK